MHVMVGRLRSDYLSAADKRRQQINTSERLPFLTPTRQWSWPRPLMGPTVPTQHCPVPSLCVLNPLLSFMALALGRP